MPGSGRDENDTRPAPLVVTARADFAGVLIAFREAGFGARIELTDSIGEAKALLLYRRTEGAEGLVCVDVDFYGNSGFELVQWIKGTAGLEKRRVVALVGAGNIRDVSLACEAGADSFAVKPLSGERLVGLSHYTSRTGLKEDLRRAVAENKELQSELKKRRSKLDVVMAESKEVKKQIPFKRAKPDDGKGPEAE